MDELKKAEQKCPLSERISLSVADAALMLGVSERLVYEWQRQYSDFPAVKLGGRLLISRSALEEWFSQQLERRCS